MSGSRLRTYNVWLGLPVVLEIGERLWTQVAIGFGLQQPRRTDAERGPRLVPGGPHDRDMRQRTSPALPIVG
jgi:hypothetical protein